MSNDHFSVARHETRVLPSFGSRAVFLDFDGTLTEIVDRPEDVGWHHEQTQALNAVVAATGGATAVVSGRGLRDLETLLQGFEGVLVGGHGAELQGGGASQAVKDLGALLDKTKSSVAHLDGVWIEEKAAGFTVHYRANADAGRDVKATLCEVVGGREDLHVFPAKMAWEVRPAAHSKGAAITHLMARPPFQGRQAIFAGDDTTDFAAFPDVVDIDGLTIAVGNTDVDADFHVSGPRDVRRWLFGEQGPWDA